MKKYLCWFFLLHFLFLVTTKVVAQIPVYRNLVMEGGGIRGIAYGGALAELEKRGILNGIERVGGTSAGAIQAAFLALGYTPQEITNITFATPVQKFTDGRLFFLGGIPRLTNQFGWYRGEKFKKWLGYHIEAKTGNPDLTFAQLHALVGKNNIRDLYVMGTNLTQQKPICLSFENYPDMKIKDAVRISMSIPLFFRAVFMDANGNLVKKPSLGNEVQVLVDGGILANYPIDLFDHPTYFNQIPTDSSFFNFSTLGIRLDTDDQIKYDQIQAGLAPMEIKQLGNYLHAFYALIIEQLNRQQLKPADWNRTISVSTKGYGPRLRRLSEKDKAVLLESGRQGVQTFLIKQTRQN